MTKLTATDILQNERRLLEEAAANALVALRNGTGTAKAFEEAKAALARYDASQQPVSDDQPWFKDKMSAFLWYAEQGGQRQKSSFYSTVPADGRRVSRLAVSEMLRGERRPAAGDGGGYGNQREADEARKVKADADKAEMQAEEMRREQDKKWLHQDQAWEALAAIVGTLRDSLRHQFHVGSAALIHLAAGDPQRGPEVYEAADECIARAFNEVLASNRIEGIFAAEEDELVDR